MIAKPGEIGDVPVRTFQVDIRKDASTTVALKSANPPKTPVSNQSATVSGPRTTSRPGSGILIVTSDLSGRLLVDGDPQQLVGGNGFPWFITGLEPGMHVLRIQFPDGKTEMVTVNLDKTTDLTVKFPPPEP